MSSLFATKIPLEANFLDIISALEPLGPIKHITISKPKEETRNGKPPKDFQSCFIDYEDEETAQKVLETAGTAKGKSLVSEQMLNDKIVKICDEPIVLQNKIERDTILERMEKKDKRHLNLLYEGHITMNDKAAEGVPIEQMHKRSKIFKEMQEKLTDTNNSLVPTRLCVMDVPENIGTGRLRKIFAVAANKYARNHKKFPECQKALKNTVRITEVRKVESQKGLFFIEFSLHEHALCALRQTNNNPEIFGGQRMIVHFAIANSFATKERRQKLERKKQAKLEQIKKREQRSKIEFEEPEDDDDDDFAEAE